MNGGIAEFFKTGHVNSDVRFLTISVKRGKGRRTLTDNVRIVMGIYPMEIPLFPLQPATIGLLLSYDKVDGIREKISSGDKYGTKALLQVRKGEGDQPPPLYEPVIGRIETAVNHDTENLIVDGMEETYYFILDHQIREFISLWDRADDASKATIISGTAVAVPLRII